MISLQDCRAKLALVQYKGSAFFLSVSDALSLADAMENFDAVPPAAYVYTASERSSGNRLATGGRRQRVDTTIGISFCLGAERADEERVDQTEVARGLILQAMTGFAPEGAADGLDFSSYRMVATGGGFLWGEALFTAPWVLNA